MNGRFLFALLALVVLSACNQVTGQKDRGKVVLKTSTDSVAYAIGNDVGHRLREQLREVEFLDTLNMDAMANGFRAGLDSLFADSAVNKALVNFQLAMQQRYNQRQQAEAEDNLRKGEAWLLENGKKPGVQTTASGLQYEVLQNGTGAKPTMADRVTVNYKGTLIDGSEFDSSYRYGRPATFGLDQVMQGWQEGLQLMATGSRWKLYVPAGLAYGPTRGPGGELPPNSVLVFEVELLDVQPAGK